MLSGLPGTAKDLKSLIYRTTTCGPSGPSGPSGGDSSLMVSLVGKARHDEIKKWKKLGLEQNFLKMTNILWIFVFLIYPQLKKSSYIGSGM